MADEYIGKTLEDFRRQITVKINEASRLLVTVNTLEEMMGDPKSSLADFIGDEAEHATTPNQLVPSVGARGAVATFGFGRSPSPKLIKPDQFLGQPPLEAAKRYLAMVGHAVHFDEIADAVQRGGAAAKGADWRDKLEMSLLKSVYEVVKVQDKTYGLVSFYSEEQILGLRGTRRRPESKSKGKRGHTKKHPRASTTKQPKQTANAEPTKPKRSAPPAASVPVEDKGSEQTPGPTDQVH